ncbi:Apt Adenine/guanine phosphoribosyltransferases and related PRPP-binding proteins [Candidatus Nanopelagicaceae bacterium]
MDITSALALIRPIPDFPKPGILFQDISPLLASPEGFATVINALCEVDPQSVIVAGVEARGFILGSAMAIQRKAGFVPIRKKGKLPYKTFSRSYGLEYGADELEIHIDALSSGERVLLVDDVLATGGTIDAALHLISEAGGICDHVVVLCEIDALEGRAALLQKYPNLVITALVHS